MKFARPCWNPPVPASDTITAMRNGIWAGCADDLHRLAARFDLEFRGLEVRDRAALLSSAVT